MRQGIPLVILLACALAPLPAWAAPSVGGPSVGPQEEACKDRAVGDACTLPNRQLGTCASSTCNRLDYSQGSPPRSVEEACVVCQAGAAQPDGQPGDAQPMVGSGGPPADSAGAEDAGADEDGPDAASSADDSSAPPKTDSRCQVAPTKGGSPGGAVGLAILALVSVARRRSRS